MADALASPVLMVVLNRINSLDNILLNTSSWQKIRLILVEIQKVIFHAEKISEENQAIRRWLAEVKTVAYDADDLLEEAQLFYSLKVAKKVVIYDFSHLKLELKLHKIEARLSKLKLELKLQKIEARLSKLLQTCKLFGAFSSNESVEQEQEQERHTISLIHESNIFGRQDDKEFVIDWLLNEFGDGKKGFPVISIVGIGGIGKTTLAKLVFNDKRVVDYYDLRVWVYVSEEFNLIRVVKEILEAATRRGHDDIDVLSLDALGRRLNQVLRGKRFLLVLDDVWQEDYSKWLMLVPCFSEVDPCSKVVLTTRTVRVAAAFGGFQYFLGSLSYDESWALLRHMVFGHSRDGNREDSNLEHMVFGHSRDGNREDSNLEQMGMRIIERCQGVPLAIEMLGSLLRFKKEESEWLSILNTDMRNLPEDGSSILPVLRLSYDNLSPHLKLCFAFCSVFPRGYTIIKEKLVWWWIANGFVGLTGQGSTSEDNGNYYFMELLERLFFTDVARDEYGDIVECQMHDFIHDLALYVAGKGCSVVETGLPHNISNELRHISLVHSSGPSTIPEELHQAKNLRTLLLLSGNIKNVGSIFQVFKCLRVLDLNQSGLRELPDSVGILIHLRYLDLSRTYIKALPRSIRKLKSLQFLELFECFNLQELPKSISELTNLRHFGIRSCSLLSHMPFGIGKLQLLQTLPTFILGKTNGFGSLNDLSGLNLRGRLELKNLEHVKNPEEGHEAKLSEKQDLNFLSLSWTHDVDTRMSCEVLENLRPPPGLKGLDINGYGGLTFPSWLWYGNVLVKLSLINCSCHELPPLGQLPCLQDLHMKGLSEIKIIGREFYGDHTVGGFPSLKQLELFDMPNLLEWKNLKLKGKMHLTETAELSDHLSKLAFPCLDTLSIKGCTKLTNLPLLLNLEKLALSDCNVMLLGSVVHLESLSTLVINEFRGQMQGIKLEISNSVKTLAIYNCDDLICLLEESMQGFSSLEHLSIICCDKLISLPTGLGYLTSLQKLNLVECQELVNIPDIFPHLPFLQELTIDGCLTLDWLPDSIQSPSPHLKVVIQRCPKLETKLNLQKGQSSKPTHTPFIAKELGEFVEE